MKKRQLYIVELNDSKEQIKPCEQNDFNKNFQTAILLSLLEKGQLTKWQFDCCVDKINEK